MKPQIKARYTIDLPYLFDSDAPVDTRIKGVVSLGFGGSWLTAIANVIWHIEVKTDRKF